MCSQLDDMSAPSNAEQFDPTDASTWPTDKTDAVVDPGPVDDPGSEEYHFVGYW